MGKPKIRFKGYQEDWEQRKLSDVVNIGSGMDYKHLGEGNIPVYGTGGYMCSVDKALSNDKDAIGIGRKGTIDKPYLLRAPFWTVDTLFYCIPKEDYDLDFTSCLFQNVDWKKKDESTGVPSLSKLIISNVETDTPTFDEQIKIGEYFSNLDHLITLHQRKCEEMKTLKKYMLQKMFPQNGQLVPQIRFSGFTEDWEQRKLGELVAIYDGVHQTPDYQDSGIMFLSVENIATLKSEKYISEEAFERDYKVYPEKGDILMTRIGDVGTTNVVETAEKVAFYVSLALLKPNGIDSYFLSNAMKTNAFQKGLRERTLVTAIPQKINKDEIGKINIFITNNDEEQKKIGAYFSNLDHLITLHHRKYMKNIDLSLFAWEQRKLEAVLSLLKDGTHGTHQDAEEGPYLLSAKNIKNGQIIIDDSSDRKISEDEFNQIHTKFTLENGDILLTIVGSIGESAILESAGKFTFQRSVAFLRPSEEMTSRFLKTEIESVQFQKELNDRKSQSAQPGVYLGDLSKIPIYITSKEEQKKIGKYFSHLDNLITLHQQKCDELRNIKKFMLQNMFI